VWRVPASSSGGEWPEGWEFAHRPKKDTVKSEAQIKGRDFIIMPIGRLGTAYLAILAPDLHPLSTPLATVVTNMTSRAADTMPTYACPCLNVRIFPLSTSVSTEEGWKSVSVDESSIKIVRTQASLLHEILLTGAVWIIHRSMSI
jgi:hypothetical protein